MAVALGNPVVIVDRCMQIIINSPEGITWDRLQTRIDILSKTSKREKTKVFTYLLNKSNVWNNGSDDMSTTLFMLKEYAKETDSDENNTTKVSSESTVKRTERLKRYQSIGTPGKAAVEVKEARMPVKNEDHDVSAPINEDDLLLEMAWHVECAEDHGLTITGLRMSVPEFSDCDNHLRFQLIGAMRDRYNIGYYTKLTSSDRVIKVLMMRPGAYPIKRPQAFIEMGRKARPRTSDELGGRVTQMCYSAGSVANNAMAAALSQLNASAMFAEHAGKDADEYDEDDDNMDFDVDGEIPVTAEPLQHAAATLLKPPVTAPVAEAPPKPPVVEEPVVVAPAQPTAQAPTAEIPVNEVTRTADTLRMIAAQLEAHASTSEKVREKKARFDHLVAEARKSSEAMQFALDKHNGIIDQLQLAADELASI